MFLIDEKVLKDSKSLITISENRIGIDRELKPGSLSYLLSEDELYLTIPDSKNNDLYNKILMSDKDGFINGPQTFNDSVVFNSDVIIKGDTTLMDKDHLVIYDSIIDINKNNPAFGIGDDIEAGIRIHRNCSGDDSTEGVFIGFNEPKQQFKVSVNGLDKITYAVVEKLLNVPGNISTDNINTTNCLIGNNLNVNGISFLKGNVTSEGKITAGSIVSNGSISALTATINSDISIKNNATISNLLTTKDLNVTGNSNFTGSSSFKDITATNSLTSNLSTVLNGTLTVGAISTFNKSATFNETVNFLKDITAKNLTLDILNSNTINTIDLNSSRNASFFTVDINNTLNVDGTSNFVGKATFNSLDSKTANITESITGNNSLFTTLTVNTTSLFKGTSTYESNIYIKNKATNMLKIGDAILGYKGTTFAIMGTDMAYSKDGVNHLKLDYLNNIYSFMASAGSTITMTDNITKVMLPGETLIGGIQVATNELVTQTKNGLMSKEDKIRFDAINDIVKPKLTGLQVDPSMGSCLGSIYNKTSENSFFSIYGEGTGKVNLLVDGRAYVNDGKDKLLIDSEVFHLYVGKTQPTTMINGDLWFEEISETTTFAMPISLLKASTQNTDLLITWKNPTDYNFKEVRIVRNTERIPENENDGEIIYQGHDEMCIDENVNFNNLYNYRAYSISVDNKFNAIDNPSTSIQPIIDTYERTIINPITTSSHNWIKISWENPEDFMKVILVKNINNVPQYIDDGEKFEVNNEFVDENLTEDTVYNYRVFPFKSEREYSSISIGQSFSIKTSKINKVGIKLDLIDHSITDISDDKRITNDIEKFLSIKKCCFDQNGNFISYSDSHWYSEENNITFIEIPKFYYKVIKESNSEYLYISKTKETGFKDFNAFKIKDKRYISTSLCNISENIINQNTISMNTLSDTKALLKDKFDILDYDLLYVIHILYIITNKNFMYNNEINNNYIGISDLIETNRYWVDNIKIDDKCNFVLNENIIFNIGNDCGFFNISTIDNMIVPKDLCATDKTGSCSFVDLKPNSNICFGSNNLDYNPTKNLLSFNSVNNDFYASTFLSK